jgi:hypothetical protein
MNSEIICKIPDLQAQQLIKSIDRFNWVCEQYPQHKEIINCLQIQLAEKIEETIL